MEWQPIETAPKSLEIEQWVLLFFTDKDDITGQGGYAVQGLILDDLDIVILMDGNLEINDRQHFPTHWMPLPNPPKESE